MTVMMKMLKSIEQSERWEVMVSATQRYQAPFLLQEKEHFK